MHNQNIGANIAELRKQKGITQETLADAVGVTGQSVSKWEGGGSPDTMLLPAIADYFNVSIDRLFGRKTRDTASLMDDIIESIGSLPEEERIGLLYKYCQNFIYGLSSTVLTKEMFDHMLAEVRIKAANEGTEIKFFRSESKEGSVSASLLEDLPYFMIMPEPDAGLGKRLGFKDIYVQLFKTLGDADNLRLLFFLHQREEETPFTLKLVQKKLGISPEKADESVKALEAFGFVKLGWVETDESVVATIKAMPHSQLIPFLIFTEEMCDDKATPHFQMMFEKRSCPYLRDTTAEGGDK